MSAVEGAEKAGGGPPERAKVYANRIRGATNHAVAIPWDER